MGWEVSVFLAVVLVGMNGPRLLRASTEPEFEPVVEISRIQGETRLVVPQSFEGRTGKETFEGGELSLFGRLGFQKIDMETRLQGRVSRFDFDVEVSRLKGMVWASPKRVPGRNACMDCHRPLIGDARTEAWIGEESRVLTPLPIRQGRASVLFPDADVQKAFLEIRHWIHPRGFLEGGGSIGRMRSFNVRQKAKSAWIGAVYSDRRRWSFSTQLRFSKPELYKLKREVLGRLEWRQGRNLRVGLQGGILIDGFAHYDLGYSDLGAVTVSTERYAPEDLPNIYQRLKDEKFGYYSMEVRYEYAF